MRKLLLTVVVLALLALGLDRGGVWVAERLVADNLASQEHLSAKPSVDIAGFPFLTQFAKGRYQKVTATSDAVRVGEGDRHVRLTEVGFTFRDVTTNRDFTHFHAASGNAKATVPYPALGRAFGMTIRYGGDGRVRVTKKVTIAGQTLSPTYVVTPELVSGALSLGNATLSTSVPPAAAEAVRRLLQIDLPLTGLPFDIRIDSLRATEGGVALHLSGRNLSYRAH